ncbi:MAG: prephenate dehydrogenase/arogenate dehydrogenase family protein [Endomicrobium sp.]|jgi:prephenate dehydrogenase|nr:prephenate dehydrogenase/arogenate dehydrogenase family protein [Endomicrobium sp.]
MLNICVIGLGQIGGSLGLALKDKSLKNCYYIIGIDRKQATLNTALKLKAADEVSLSLHSAKNADIVVICTPVDTIVPLYKQLSNIVNKNTIVTDAGSVKYFIEKGIKDFLKKSNGISFVGSHPMAGREKNGIFSADANIFKNANVIITCSIKQSLKSETLVAQMWKDAGANIVKMPAKKHDELVAFTSHLPHVIAFLLNKIYKKTKKRNPQIDMLTAGSFKSMTRVAASSADMWAPIFTANSQNIEKYLDKFIKELSAFKQNLKNKQKVKKKILKMQE